jgi:hypothetical protein
MSEDDDNFSTLSGSGARTRTMSANNRGSFEMKVS